MSIKPFAVAALVTAAALAFTGCATNEAAPAGTGSASGAQTLTGVGASSQKAAQEKWVADFQTKNSSITVNYSRMVPARAARPSSPVQPPLPAPTVRSRTKRWAPASSPVVPLTPTP